MRQELVEIMQIDQYLLGRLSPAETADIQVAGLVNAEFANNVETQRKIHRFVRLFARKQEREKIDNIYARLMRRSSFREQITNIFRK